MNWIIQVFFDKFQVSSVKFKCQVSSSSAKCQVQVSSVKFKCKVLSSSVKCDAIFVNTRRSGLIFAFLDTYFLAIFRIIRPVFCEFGQFLVKFGQFCGIENCKRRFLQFKTLLQAAQLNEQIGRKLVISRSRPSSSCKYRR